MSAEQRRGHAPAGRCLLAMARAAATLSSILALPGTAHACSVCFGDPSSPQTQGANNAILFLLVVTVGMLGSLAAFFVYLIRQSRRSGAVAGGPRSGSRRDVPVEDRSVPVESTTTETEKQGSR